MSAAEPTGDIHVARLRKDAPCTHCGKQIPAGELVHRLGIRTAAHIFCDLRARRALRWSEAS